MIKMKREKSVFMFQEAKLILGLVLSFMGVMFLILPITSHASQQSDPVEFEIGFENPEPELNSPETLFLRITCDEYALRDETDISVNVLLPEEVRLIRGETSWRGDINKGETVEISMIVEIVETGRYGITVEVYSDPADVHMGGVPSGKLHLYIIATDEEVRASTASFLRMDFDRAKTPAEKEKLLGGPAIMGPPIPPGSAPRKPRPLPPDFFRPKEDDSKGTDDELIEGSDIGVEETITVTVSGTATYKDSAGQEHFIRFAKVKIIDVDFFPLEEIMGDGFTDKDGFYSIVATGGDIGSGPDIKVRVYSAIVSDLAASVVEDASSLPLYPYYIESDTIDDYTDPILNVPLMTTGTPIPGSLTDDKYARIFSVLDAILQAAVEAYCLRGNTPMPHITVVYPFDDGSASGGPSYDGNINIPRKDALDWDVIFHEYGHYLGHKGSSSNFINSPGGDHAGLSTIPDHGKERGIRLAWAEGWATFFGITAQVEPTCDAFGLVLPNIPNAGDRIYNDTERAPRPLALDLETVGDGRLNGEGQGYASENSISAALYDLIDSDEDFSSDSTAGDTFDYTHQYIWDELNTGDWEDVGKFYNNISSKFDDNIGAELRIAEIFAMNNIAPELQEPANEGIVSRTVRVRPTFKWNANGDPTDGFEHNKFVLYISTDNFATKPIDPMMKDGIVTNEYRFSETDWETIVQAGNADMEYKWVVRGYNDVDPRIPSIGLGSGMFLSNSHTFTVGDFDIDGQIGCLDRPAALFFYDMPVVVDLGTFYGKASGFDYDGLPIYFKVDGTYDYLTDWVTNYIYMYYDPGHISHIRTDYCEGFWDGSFYDGACVLVENTTAGCLTIWEWLTLSQTNGTINYDQKFFINNSNKENISTLAK